DDAIYLASLQGWLFALSGKGISTRLSDRAVGVSGDELPGALFVVAGSTSKLIIRRPAAYDGAATARRRSGRTGRYRHSRACLPGDRRLHCLEVRERRGAS